MCGSRTSTTAATSPALVLLPLGTIDETTAATVIPQKDSTVLVLLPHAEIAWGQPPSALAELGYTGIYVNLAVSTPGPTRQSRKAGRAASGTKYRAAP